MSSTHKKGKSVVAEGIIRTLKYKIYEYMTSVSKNVYVDNSTDTVNEYNITYHSTIKMKSVDVTLSTYSGFNKQNDKRDPIFEVGNHAAMPKCKTLFWKSLYSKLAWRGFCD